MSDRSVREELSQRLAGLEIQLPEHGTGVRAARRAARAAGGGVAGADEPAARGGDGAPEPERSDGPRAPAPVEARRPLTSEVADEEGPAPSRSSPARGGRPLVSERPIRATPPTEAPTEPERAADDGPASPPGRAPDRRRWTLAIVAALVLSMVVGGGLAAFGVQTLRDSRAGRTLTTAGPDEPGFEGFLEPTPTLAFLHAHDGVLDSVALLALANDDRGGSVVLVPPEVTVGEGEHGALDVQFAFGGTPEDLRNAVEVVSAVAVQEIVVLDDDRLAQMLAPLGSITLENPDEIDGFGAGVVALEPDDAGRWLAAREAGESPAAAMYRQELFWRAWIGAVAEAGGGDAVPGEMDAGLGRYVRGLAAASAQVLAMPVEEAADGALVVDAEGGAATIAAAVPFPQGARDVPRTVVRLLDGTGDPDHVSLVAPTVVGAQASIAVVGNADAFDYRTTEVRYHDAGHREAAERIREVLGAGRVVEDIRPSDSFDVTIVLGTDV